jgi:hypothetical protein
VPVIVNEEHLHRRLSRLDGFIRDEFEYVGQRVTWLLTSHSFLFTAFVVGLNVGVRDRTNSQRLNPADAADIIPSLLAALCWIGIVSSLVVLLGVAVAHKVVNENYGRRKATEDAARTRTPPMIEEFDAVPNRQGRLYIVGSLSGFVMPLFLAGVWFWLWLKL